MAIESLEEMAADVASRSGRTVRESRHAIRTLAVGLALTMGMDNARTRLFMEQHAITEPQALAALGQAVGL